MRALLRHITFLFILKFLLILNVTGAQELVFNTFLAQVEQTNPAVIASKLRARALESRIHPNSTLDDPFFAIGPDEIPINSEMGSVTRFQLSQSIPFPGKLGARGGIAEGRAKSASADSETTKRQIIVMATHTFYRTFYNQGAIALNERLRKILNETVQSTKTRYETGGIGHHDWLLARIELSVLDVEKLKLERERRTLHALLNEIRNEPPENLIDKVDLNRDGEPSLKAGNQKDGAAPEPSLSDSPELRSLEASIQSTEEERRLAKLSYFPDFVVQGMAMKPSSGMGKPSTWGVMIGINLPIFFWRKQSESLEAANLDLEASLFEKNVLENRLRTEIVDAKQEYKTAKDIVDLYRKDVIPNTLLAVNNARSGYAAKRLPLAQLLDVLKTQRTQELELLAAELDAQAAELRLTEVLSTPPLLRLTPSRPTLFGGGTMGAGGGMPSMGTSDTVRMGPGMSGPTRKQPKSNELKTSGMGGM